MGSGRNDKTKNRKVMIPMSDYKPTHVLGLNGETICVGDLVVDTRPHGQRGKVTSVVNADLVTVRMASAAYDITVAGRHLRIVL